MNDDLITILFFGGYMLVYLIFCAWAIIHDRKIGKEEGKFSTLSIDVVTMGYFWPITMPIFIIVYLKNKDYYKYGIPYDN